MSLARGSLVDECAVLDIGGGRSPIFLPAERPGNCRYAGLDISADELAGAPEGSYDEVWVCDVTDRRSELEARFDLAVSWQVLEHVRPLEDALENIRSYLGPGGRLIATLSGAASVFALVSRAIPTSLGAWAMHRLLGRDPATVFPAYYDHCWQTALERALGGWSRFQVTPFYIGAAYLEFLRPLQKAYLRYEEWALRNGHRNLATHYLIEATK